MAKPYGLLLVGFNYATAAEDEFNDWYDTEHIPERERTPGFIKAQRWLGTQDDRVAVATYDLEALDVLQTPAYKAIAGENLSPWSKRVGSKCKRICRLEAEQISPGRQVPPDGAGAMMMFAMNVAPEADADFNKWYDEEHIPALLKVPGCLTARRYVMPAGTLRYLAIYHLTSPDVLESDAWKNAVATPWTARLRPHFRDPLRLVLRPYVRKA